MPPGRSRRPGNGCDRTPPMLARVFVGWVSAAQPTGISTRTEKTPGLTSDGKPSSIIAVLRHPACALAVILALGIAARLWFLHRPMQYDEAYTYNEYAS